jgi:hypothetical protein
MVGQLAENGLASVIEDLVVVMVYVTVPTITMQVIGCQRILQESR